MKKEHMVWLGVGIVVGMVFYPQLRRLPVVNKIPTA